MKPYYFTHYLYLLLLCSFTTPSKQFIDSKIIEGANPSKEVYTSRGGMEGWANVSYIIGLDGKARDIVVFDYSDKKRYIDSAIEHVKNKLFQPANIDGVPVITPKTQQVFQTFSAARYSEGSVTPGFAKDYQTIIDGLSKTDNDLKQTKLLIDELIDDHTKNLNEHALAAWLSSIYYYKNKDFLEYMRQSSIAFNLYEHLPLPIISKVSVNLFEAQNHFGYFNEAHNTLTKMGEIDGLNLSPEVKAQFLQQLRLNQKNSQPINVEGKLSTLGAWVYLDAPDNFKILPTTGSIDSIEVRCLGFHKVYPYKSEAYFSAPTQSNSCITLVFGEVGTIFNLQQTKGQPNT